MSGFLSPSMRRTLEELRDNADQERYEDAEIVCDGLECWLGQRRIARMTVNKLQQLTSISDVSDQNGGTQRFTINETGRNILKDESQVPELFKALRAGGAWTWRDGKLVPLKTP
jgi:hypothetical protein